MKGVQKCVGKRLTTGSLEQGKRQDLQCLPNSVMQILLLWLISSYQLDIAECEVGKRCP